MLVSEIQSRFRQVDRAQYPLLKGLETAQIYDGKMGPGGLYLAAQMSQKAFGNLPDKARVMDLACGQGNTSIFLARTFDVQVFAVDLWISANDLYKNIQHGGCEDKVLPFNLDITKSLPFADFYFDAIFCMDGFHYFGANPGLLDILQRLLKPGADLVIGNPCFDREFDAPPPPVYQTFWDDEFSRYHSPGYWHDLVTASGKFTDVHCHEACDGVIYWEDSLLHDIASGKSERVEADADEIVFGHEHPEYPYLTHYVLSCKSAKV